MDDSLRFYTSAEQEQLRRNDYPETIRQHTAPLAADLRFCQFPQVLSGWLVLKQASCWPFAGGSNEGVFALGLWHDFTADTPSEEIREVLSSIDPDLLTFLGLFGDEYELEEQFNQLASEQRRKLVGHYRAAMQADGALQLIDSNFEAALATCATKRFRAST